MKRLFISITGHKMCNWVTFPISIREKESKEVRLEEVSGDILRTLISYIYTGEIKLTQQCVMELLPAANMLGLGEIHFMQV